MKLLNASHCINPKRVDDSGNNALHLAAENGSLEVMAYLLDECGYAFSDDINKQNDNGETALHIAVQFPLNDLGEDEDDLEFYIKQAQDLVELLVTREADVTIKNEDEQTALEVAQQVEVDQEIDLSEIITYLQSKSW